MGRVQICVEAQELSKAVIERSIKGRRFIQRMVGRQESAIRSTHAASRVDKIPRDFVKRRRKG